MTKNFKAIKNLGLPFNSWFSWLNLAKNSFDYANKHGEVFHLWGHSWEIEKYGMWKQLEELFKYINNQSNILPLTNSEVLKNHEDSIIK